MNLKKTFGILLLSLFIAIMITGLISKVNAQSKLGNSIISRIPIYDNEINQTYYFDGSNYIMITKYGNYTFLDPHYIVEYYNLNGTEIIDKMVWVLQHDTWGTWESLEDFENIELFVNHTEHILTYGINVKDKGKNYIIANISQEFYSSGYSQNIPKFFPNMTKTEHWDNLGYGNHRWILVIVPKGNYFRYVNRTLRDVRDIRYHDIEGYDYRIFLTENDKFNESDNWLVIDYSDYNISYFKGGNEDYWNGKGFTLIFPINETCIDPVVIDTAEDYHATRESQQRRIFKNPRGLGYYYAVFENQTDYLGIYYSQDGVTWNTSTGYQHYGYFYRYPDLVIYDEEDFSRLIMALIVYDATGNLDLILFEIEDDEYIPQFETLKNDLITPTDDTIYNPNIEIDDDGYLWISWCDEYSSKGKQRNDVYVIGNDDPYPYSGLSFNTSLKVFDGSTKTQDPHLNAQTELVQINATGDMAIVMGYDDNDDGNNELHGYVLTRGNPPTAGTDTLLDADVLSEYLFSSVSETSSDSDIFILFEDGDYYAKLIEWDISANSASIYGTVHANPAGTHYLTLTIDQTVNPDLLYCFTRNGTTGKIYYHTTEVDSFSLSEIYTIETLENENIYWLQSPAYSYSSCDQIFIIYTGTDAEVEFWILSFSPENIEAIISDFDDTDNLYAERKYYSLETAIRENNTYSQLDYILVNITQDNTVRACFKYDEGLDSFSWIYGEWEIDSGGSSATKSGVWCNATFKIFPSWDALEESDFEIKLFCIDETSLNDSDTMQTNYGDVIITLMTDTIECGDSNDPDRVPTDVLSSISGTIRYVNNPSSLIASSFYPPDSEFNNVSVMDSLDSIVATDNTITNGGVYVTFYESVVKLEVYNFYVDLNDTDWTDKELNNLNETIIWDRILFYYFVSDESDNRTDINDNIEIRVRGLLEYDNHLLGPSDTVNVNGTTLNWDAINLWFDNSFTESIVGNYSFVFTSPSLEATYQITSRNQNVSNPYCIFDRILIYWNVNETEPINNVPVNFTLETIKYDYDDVIITTYTYDVLRNHSLFLNDYAYNNFTDVNSDVIYNYTLTDFTETNYGITVLWLNVTYYNISWGEALITPAIPNLLFGAGFTANISYIEIYWNHSNIAVDYYEIHHSTDNITFSFLALTTYRNYTHSNLVNESYHYYKVRADNLARGSWYNSSFSPINLERVYFTVGNGVSILDDYASLFVVGLTSGIILIYGITKR